MIYAQTMKTISISSENLHHSNLIKIDIYHKILTKSKKYLN